MLRRASYLSALGAWVVVVMTASCGGSASTIPAPTPTLTTENFSGTISPLGTDSHTFMVNFTTASSDASITVSSLTTVANATPQAITIGVGFGVSNVGVCTRSSGYSNPAAPLGTELSTSGAPFVAGQYCVQIFDNPDSPTVTEPLKYAIVVKHY